VSHLKKSRRYAQPDLPCREVVTDDTLHLVECLLFSRIPLCHLSRRTSRSDDVRPDANVVLVVGRSSCASCARRLQVRLAIGDITPKLAMYGPGIHGIGDYIPDPTAFFGMSSCPAGYVSDGQGGCVLGIAPSQPFIGPSDTSASCPTGFTASGGTCYASGAPPSYVWNPATGTYQAPGQYPFGVNNPNTGYQPQPITPTPKPIGKMSTTQLVVIGVSALLVFAVLLPAARGGR
jgi:hypothetical protein